MRRVIPVALMLALAGCVTGEKGLAPREIPFTPGKTTFREVVAEWGNPDSIKKDEAIWTATLSNGGAVKASYMFVGVTLTSANLATRECRLKFDEKGVLVSQRVCDSIPEGATWTILPW